MQIYRNNKKPEAKDMKATFKFIGVKDCGETNCPHCGAMGRYIYEWEEDGVSHAAMAGCYQKLTKGIQKDEKQRYFEILYEKQAKNKPLNGWDKSVILLLSFKKSGNYPAEWCDNKIDGVLSERHSFLNKRR